MRKIRVTIGVLIILSLSYCLYAQYTESVQMSTYFPAPQGSFVTLSVNDGIFFIPHDGTGGDYISAMNCNAVSEGMLTFGFLDAASTEMQFYFCASTVWTPLGF